jgi:hypothetical protein
MMDWFLAIRKPMRPQVSSRWNAGTPNAIGAHEGLSVSGRSQICDFHDELATIPRKTILEDEEQRLCRWFAASQNPPRQGLGVLFAEGLLHFPRRSLMTRNSFFVPITARITTAKPKSQPGIGGRAAWIVQFDASAAPEAAF